MGDSQITDERDVNRDWNTSISNFIPVSEDPDLGPLGGSLAGERIDAQDSRR